jgi:hypothetical protein
MSHSDNTPQTDGIDNTDSAAATRGSDPLLDAFGGALETAEPLVRDRFDPQRTPVVVAVVDALRRAGVLVPPDLTPLYRSGFDGDVLERFAVPRLAGTTREDGGEDAALAVAFTVDGHLVWCNPVAGSVEVYRGPTADD